MKDLEQRARKVLAEASVVAEAPGCSFIPSGGRQYGWSELPLTSGVSLHDRILDRLLRDQLVGPISFERAIVWAEHEVKDSRKGKPKPKLDTKRMVLSQFGGDDYRKVAEIVGVHCTTVFRWRTAAGLDGVTGLDPLASVAVVVHESVR